MGTLKELQNQCDEIKQYLVDFYETMSTKEKRELLNQLKDIA